jgi:hypothetical protein
MVGKPRKKERFWDNLGLNLKISEEKRKVRKKDVNKLDILLDIFMLCVDNLRQVASIDLFLSK